MARATGLLENVEGHLGELTVYKRGKKTYVRPTHIYQPRRLSREQLRVRERQSHNNALWRALKGSGRVYFDGDRAAYNQFMSINTFAPVPYLKKGDHHNTLLLPEMVLSDGPLNPIGYQLGEVDGQPALLTDLTKGNAGRMTLLLYVLEQKVYAWPGGSDMFQLKINAEPLTASDFVNVPSTLASPYKATEGTLALVGERYGNPMMGFGLVQIKDGVASHQRVVTRCTYYERYTTEEALQEAAKSYGGLTGERKEG